MRNIFLASLLSLSLPTATLLAEEEYEEYSEEDSYEEYSEDEDSYDEEYSEEEEGSDDEFDDEEWEDEEESSLEVSGFLKNESSWYTQDLEKRGETIHDAGNMMKSESSLNLFINYGVTDETNLHIQTNFIYDTEAVDNYRGHRGNTQHDYLREFYIDTAISDWVELRVGKQQEAWGTADGVKFLDIINPTDYREWGQNSMEDSRIPLWMLKATLPIGDDGTSSLQFVWVPDLEVNQIPGLYDPETGDAEQPFVSLGADTMTGKYNGFYNIAKDMGKTSTIFDTLLNMGGMRGLTGPMKYRTVSFFTSLGTPNNMTFGDVQSAVVSSYGTLENGITNDDVDPTLVNGGFDAQAITDCFGIGTQNSVNLDLLNTVFIPMLSGMENGNNVLNAAANEGSVLFSNFQNYMGVLQQAYMGGQDISFGESGAELVEAGTGHLSNSTIGSALNSIGTMMYQQVAMGMNLDPTDPNSQMAVAEGLGLDPTSETFQQEFAQKIQEIAMPEIAKVFTDGTTNQFDGVLSPDTPTSAFDYMGNTAFGTFRYFKNMRTVYRKDHEIENLENSNGGIRWKSSIGSSINYSLNYYSHWDNNPYVDLHWEDSKGKRLTPNFVTHDAVPMFYEGKFVPTDMNQDGTPETVTALESMTRQDGSEFTPETDGSATLVFTEKMNRINSYGTSFDATIDTPLIPIVLRGEFLYETGVKTPVVDKLKLSYGDLAGALYMEEADFMKGVIGVDVTLFTNLFTSFQYMHVHNMDFIEETKTYNGKSYEVYTANPATLSLSNNMKKAEEDQQMYTFFLSKPFLEGDVLRVNNLFLLEGEDGGFWNRFDMEYTYTDSLILRAEYNVYGGDDYGIFGQFADQSSIQLGAKYLF
jgi:hypothetical protein